MVRYMIYIVRSVADQKFQFMVTSGKLSYNLIDLKSGRMSIMIPGVVPNTRGQQAFCFVKQGSIYELHFCTRNLNVQNFHSS